MKTVYRTLRFIGHSLLPGSVRHKLYLIPYYFYINKFMRDVDPEKDSSFTYIEIETINRCNGSCEFCPVNINRPQRPYAKMNEGLFRKIIDELADISYSGEIHLFSNNEPFLDDRIYGFAEYTRRKVPDAFISIYTNGSLLKMDDLIRIIKNIDLLVIDDYNLKFSEQNIKEIKKWCMSGAEDSKKVQIDERDATEVLSSRGGNSPNKQRTSLFGVSKGCIYPFRQIVIRPDGKCSLCCNDAFGQYTLGDVNNNSLIEVWNSQEYKKIRKKMKDNGRKGLKLCNKCDTHYFDGT